MAKRNTLLTGSMAKPLFRYVINARIEYNPFTYPNGQHFNKLFKQYCNKWEKKRLQDDYVWSSAETMNPRVEEN